MSGNKAFEAFNEFVFCRLSALGVCLRVAVKNKKSKLGLPSKFVK